MQTSQQAKPKENSIYKIKTNLEKLTSIVSRKPQKLVKRGRQPLTQKMRYFPLEDKETFISNINIIPKRSIRAKNKSSQKLFIRNINNKSQEKKSNEENDSDSENSNSNSREYKIQKLFGDIKGNTLYSYPTKKDVGLSSSEEDNSSDNSFIEENFGMEIERILIEIYNKNISNIHNNKKNKGSAGNIPGEEHVR